MNAIAQGMVALSLGVPRDRLQRLASKLWIGISIAVALAAAPKAFAQPSTDVADPPGRVARLADITGTAWVLHADAGDWKAARRNQTLTRGDRLSTDADARVELRIGSTTFRVDGGSELDFTRLDDERVVAQLDSGKLFVRIRRPEVLREFLIKTQEGELSFDRAGRYRLESGDGTTVLTTIRGQASFAGSRQVFALPAGQRREVWINAAGTLETSVGAAWSDAFAVWNAERDRADDRSASLRYVSPEMTGAEDLDRYGVWERTDDFGPVWIPAAVAPDWAPYRVGHWDWVSPWGWTWVDDAPWGYAPFHYGRWAWYRARWCWVPGTLVPRPVYAPALVAWIGGSGRGSSWEISISSGPRSWLPLAPREVFVPAYRASYVHIEQINVVQVVDRARIREAIEHRGPQREPVWANREAPRAISSAPAEHWVRQSPAPVALPQPLRDRTRDVPRDLPREPARDLLRGRPETPRAEVGWAVQPDRSLPPSIGASQRDRAGAERQRAEPGPSRPSATELVRPSEAQTRQLMTPAWRSGSPADPQPAVGYGSRSAEPAPALPPQGLQAPARAAVPPGPITAPREAVPSPAQRSPEPAAAVPGAEKPRKELVSREPAREPVRETPREAVRETTREAVREAPREAREVRAERRERQGVQER